MFWVQAITDTDLLLAHRVRLKPRTAVRSGNRCPVWVSSWSGFALRTAGCIHSSHSISRRSRLRQLSTSDLAMEVPGALCRAMSGPMQLAWCIFEGNLRIAPNDRFDLVGPTGLERTGRRFAAGHRSASQPGLLRRHKR